MSKKLTHLTTHKSEGSQGKSRRKAAGTQVQVGAGGLLAPPPVAKTSIHTRGGGGSGAVAPAVGIGGGGFPGFPSQVLFIVGIARMLQKPHPLFLGTKRLSQDCFIWIGF